MRLHHISKIACATGLFAITLAQAATGYTVTSQQETQVMPGMSSDQVRQALGQPDRDVKFRNEPGPTWTYRLVGGSSSVFDVDFDADGKVISTSERMNDSGDGGS